MPYLTGGAGYILSKAALRRFAEATKNDSRTRYPRDGTSEDVAITRFLHRIGVQYGNTTDASGGTLFHHFPFDIYVKHKFSKKVVDIQVPITEVVSIYYLMVLNNHCLKEKVKSVSLYIREL